MKRQLAHAVLAMLVLAGCGKSEPPAPPAPPPPPVPPAAAVPAPAAASEAPKAVTPAPAAPADSGRRLYTVDGNKVDAKTLEGFRTWRALACERCHGAQQEGGVGPALVDSLKRLSHDEFKVTVLKGRPGTAMAPFESSQQVANNIDNLYAYLKGRSDGAIPAGRLEALAP